MVDSPDEVFKILTREQYDELATRGHFPGSEDDRRDGFIHLSFEAQLEQTLSKHFAGQSDLVILRLSRVALGPALRLEPSRGGQLFPHLYRELHQEDVLELHQEG